MKKHFLTGLAILLPFILTFIIFIFVLHLIINPFVGPATQIVNFLIPQNHTFLFFTHEQWVRLLSKCLVIGTLIGVVLSAGLLGQLYVGDYLLKMIENVFMKVPLFRTIYKTLHDVVNILFSSNPNSFTKAVLVQFPHAKAYCLGMATTSIEEPFVSVFLPGTPNPSVGYVLQFRKEQLIVLDMSVDDAFKVIVSCGTSVGKQGEKSV